MHTHTHRNSSFDYCYETIKKPSKKVEEKSIKMLTENNNWQKWKSSKKNSKWVQCVSSERKKTRQNKQKTIKKLQFYDNH